MFIWFVLVTLIKMVVSTGGENSDFYDYHQHIDKGYNNSVITHLHKAIDAKAFRIYNGSLYKCLCNGSQAWDGWACVDTPTKVAVFEAETGRTSIVDTGHFKVVTVGEPQCPSGNTLATLDSSHDLVHQFSLLPSGHLYWHKREFQFYCIDHMLKDDTGETPWMLAHVCLSPPSVPRCCPPGRALTDDLSCSGHTSQGLAPPIMVDGLQIQWPGESPSQVEDITCSHHQDLLTIELTSSVAFLKYSPDRVSFVWSPPLSQWKEQEHGYCVGIMQGRREDYIVLVCHEDVRASHQRQCNQSTCVRKCCSDNEVLEGTACRVAENNNELWKPVFYDPLHVSFAVAPPDNVMLIVGYPLCENYYQLEPHVDEVDTFTLLISGSLYVNSFQEYYPASQYCIDNFYSHDNIIYTQALVCFEENVGEVVCDATKKYVYPVLLLVSSGFLCVTLVIYANVPDLRKKLNGKCLISLVSALLVGYISLSVSSLAAGKMPELLCKITASVIHLAVLAGFFWLNIMCFDIWRTLSKMRTVSGTPAWIHRRFMLYSLYSWGCPLLITIVAVIIEALPESHKVIRPDFGTDFCWFNTKKSLWVYLYIYILVLVLANMVFFTLVAMILCRSQNNALLKRSREVNRERLWLCGKLFLVMGVTWLAEVISWQQGNCQAWIVADAINALQGLSIFLVFVCSRTTIRKVQATWPCCCRRNAQIPISPSTTYTSVSSRSRWSAALPESGPSPAKDSMALPTLREVHHQPDPHNHHHPQPFTTYNHHRPQSSTTDHELEDSGRKSTVKM